MAYKPIFLIGNAYGKNATIPTGINGSRRLIKHSLRIAQQNQDFVKSQNQISNIDRKRTKNNWFFSSKTNQWKTFRDKNHRQNVMAWFNKKLAQTLEPFKEQFEQKKRQRMTQKNDSTRYTTFNEYMAKKQPMAEWILSGSKEWFQHNNVIKIDPTKPTTFTVLNQQKLLQWANTVQTWAIGQVASFYGKDAFVMSNLHLDEGNIHIHFNFMRAVHKWNQKENKMSWAFTNNGFLDRQKIKVLHQTYRDYQNKVLFQDLHWEKTYTLAKPESGIKYLRLLEYKTAQAEKNLERINREIAERSFIEQQQHHKMNPEIIKEAKQLIYRGMKQNEPKLVLAGHDMLLNEGVEPTDIEEIKYEIYQEM